MGRVVFLEIPWQNTRGAIFSAWIKMFSIERTLGRTGKFHGGPACVKNFFVIVSILNLLIQQIILNDLKACYSRSCNFRHGIYEIVHLL